MTAVAAHGVNTWELARAAAERVEAEQLRCCVRRRVDVTGLAKELDILVRTRADLGPRARWQRYQVACDDRVPRLWDPATIAVDVIDVRAGLRESARRFAIAHEIGHVLLHRAPPNVELADHAHERIANAFAAELLIPRAFREEIAEDFRGAAHPTELLRLSDSLGISPRTILRFARAHNWMQGLDRLWLDVRSLLNHHTQRDRRPRIFDTVLDRERWFLPRNRSVAGVVGSDEWLDATGRRISSTEAHIDIAERCDSGRVRFIRRRIPAHLAAVRLRRATSGEGMEILASADLSA